MTLGARWTSLLLVGLGSTALLTACSDQPLEPVIEAAASGSGSYAASYPKEPGRKSTPRLSPMLAVRRSWTSSSAS